VVLELLAGRVLVAGDHLVLDNASIHKAAEIIDTLTAVLDRFSVTIIFLPAYSPELNPCELVFAQVKSYLRRNRGSGSFADELIDSFRTVSYLNVVRYYDKCLSVL